MDLLLLDKGNVTRSCQSINWIARLPVKCPAYLSFLNSITSILVVSRGRTHGSKSYCSSTSCVSIRIKTCFSLVEFLAENH